MSARLRRTRGPSTSQQTSRPAFDDSSSLSSLPDSDDEGDGGGNDKDSDYLPTREELKESEREKAADERRGLDDARPNNGSTAAGQSARASTSKGNKRRPARQSNVQDEENAVPTPLLDTLLRKAASVLRLTRDEAGVDDTIQTLCYEKVDQAIKGLPTDTHKRTLCLVMNRYAAFCSSPAVDVPEFPMTLYKIVLFMARCLDHRIGTALRNLFPQPQLFPLPVVDDYSIPLGSNEGMEVSRELVKSWLEALAYVATQTRVEWAGRISGHETNSIADVTSHPLVVELLSLLPSANDLKDPPRKRTKWSKGGQLVLGPSRKSGENSNVSLSPVEGDPGASAFVPALTRDEGSSRERIRDNLHVVGSYGQLPIIRQPPMPGHDLPAGWYARQAPHQHHHRQTSPEDARRQTSPDDVRTANQPNGRQESKPPIALYHRSDYEQLPPVLHRGPFSRPSGDSSRHTQDSAEQHYRSTFQRPGPTNVMEQQHALAIAAYTAAQQGLRRDATTQPTNASGARLTDTAPPSHYEQSATPDSSNRQSMPPPSSRPQSRASRSPVLDMHRRLSISHQQAGPSRLSQSDLRSSVSSESSGAAMPPPAQQLSLESHQYNRSSSLAQLPYPIGWATSQPHRPLVQQPLATMSASAPGDFALPSRTTAFHHQPQHQGHYGVRHDPEPATQLPIMPPPLHMDSTIHARPSWAWPQPHQHVSTMPSLIPTMSSAPANVVSQSETSPSPRLDEPPLTRMTSSSTDRGSAEQGDTVGDTENQEHKDASAGEQQQGDATRVSEGQDQAGEVQREEEAVSGVA